MTTSTKTLRDKELLRQLQRLRLAGHEVAEITRLVEATLREFARRLEWRLRRADALGLDPGPVSTAVLRRQIDELASMLGGAVARAYEAFRDELAAIGADEAASVERILRRSFPPEMRAAVFGVAGADPVGFGSIGLRFFRPTPELLATAIQAQAFEGVALEQAFGAVAETARAQMIRTARIGVVAGDDIPTIARALVPAARAVIRRDLRTIARTAVAGVMQDAREIVYQQNRGLVQLIVWLATLDLRTCPICGPRDQKKYTREHAPVGHDLPWLAGPGRVHPGDRCTSYAVLKSWREMGINRSELSPSARRALDGKVPGKTVWETWLRGRSPEEVSSVFGKTRAEAFLAGKLSPRDMITDGGSLISLDELRALGRLESDL